MKISWCKKCLFLDKNGNEEPCRYCIEPLDVSAEPTEYTPKRKRRKMKPVTTADKIRRMDDQELAVLFKHVCIEKNNQRTADEWLEWLKTILVWEVEKK